MFRDVENHSTIIMASTGVCHYDFYASLFIFFHVCISVHWITDVFHFLTSVFLSFDRHKGDCRGFSNQRSTTVRGIRFRRAFIPSRSRRTERDRFSRRPQNRSLFPRRRVCASECASAMKRRQRGNETSRKRHSRWCLPRKRRLRKRTSSGDHLVPRPLRLARRSKPSRTGSKSTENLHPRLCRRPPSRAASSPPALRRKTFW